MEREYAVELSRVFRAERAIVWAIVADTNRWDRAAGLKPPRYSWAVVDGKRVRVGESRELGLDLKFIEPPYRWVEGRSLEGERRFISGPVSRGGFSVTLEDTKEGTLVRARTFVAGPWWVGIPQRFKFARALPRYLDAIGRLLAPFENKGVLGNPDEPAVVRARRTLEGNFDSMTAGPRSPVVEAELARRLDRLSASCGYSTHIGPLAMTLRELPDDAVATLRPFEVARTWNAERRDVLRTFLYATEAGLLDLRWQVNCPVCRVGASNASSMSELSSSAHCDACDIDYGVDFARHVEAVFSPNSAVRRAEPSLFCASSPAFLPHVLAQLSVPAKGALERTLDLVPGTFHLRRLNAALSADIALETPNVHLDVTIEDTAVSVVVTERKTEGATIAITNRTDTEAILLVERSAWSADAALGTAVATFPEFVRLFATEAPASGVELRVGEVALLFSDLTGSTALYERIGDARAFALVEEHFKKMTEVIDASGGAVVKTMGDAVMASFPSLLEAVEAALAMVVAHDRAFASHDLGVKIGVHSGPSLAVRANDRFDFFGTTVNVAARLQAQACSGELVLMQSAAEHPAIAPLLAGHASRQFTANLKGIAASQTLIGVTIT